MPQRLIRLSVEESIAIRIEDLTKRPLREVAQELIDGFLEDRRRRQSSMVELGVSWPLDWYAQMLKVWGENKVADNVRQVLYDFMMKDSKRGKWMPSPVPELRDREQVLVSRTVKPRPDRKTFISKILIPEDWSVWLEEHYPGKRSTYVKLAIYHTIVSWPWSRGKSPSIPNGMLKFEGEYF